MGKRRVVLSGLRLVLGIGFLGLLSGCAGVCNKPSVDKGLLPAPMRGDNGAEAAPVVVTPPASAEAETAPADRLHVSETPCLWPVDEDDHIILSSFGYRGRRRGGPGSFHRAVDIRASMNAPVLASAAGTVKKAAAGGNYGKLVVLDHGNGYESLYAHLNEIDVEPGQKVACGERIGLAGRTGNATCTHVHYEILCKEEAVNPVEFLPMDGVRIEQFASLAPAEPSKASKESLASAKGSRKDVKKGGKTLVAKKASKDSPSRGKAAKEAIADTADDVTEAKSSPKAKTTKTASVEKKASAASEKASKAAKADSDGPKKTKSVEKSTAPRKSAPAKAATETKTAKASATRPAVAKAETSKAGTKTTKAGSSDKPKTAAKAETGKKAASSQKAVASKKTKS